MVKVGDAVIYITPTREEVPALVQHVWARGGDQLPGVNLVFVSQDANRKDSYGRQVEHATSVSPESDFPGVGRTWRAPAYRLVKASE